MLFYNMAECLHIQSHIHKHNYNERWSKLLFCDIIRIFIFDQELREEEAKDCSGLKTPSVL